jgi:hypothetical protein
VAVAVVVAVAVGGLALRQRRRIGPGTLPQLPLAHLQFLSADAFRVQGSRFRV